MAAKAVLIPWYATGFRGDRFEQALAEIAPVALRYGATSYSVYRADDDRYKFTHLSSWKSKQDFTAYWEGPEFRRFRVITSGWYQVPVLYAWQDVSAEGALAEVVEDRPGPLPDVA
jgi:quinol monooxygenase YgiN